MDEKIARGRNAITALQTYRKAKKEDNKKGMEASLGVLDKDMKYFGYGYIKDKADLVPSIPVNFYAFRIMVGLGTLFILFFAVALFLTYRKDITKLKWLHIAGISSLPLGYIASESGWLVAEFGRQPWTIQDMLPTWVAVSNLQSGSVIITFFIFLILFTLLLCVEINILCKQIKKGPEYSLAEIGNRG